MHLLGNKLLFVPVLKYGVYFYCPPRLITLLKNDFVSLILSSIVILLKLKRLACNHPYLFRLLNSWELLLRQGRILLQNSFDVLHLLSLHCFHSVSRQVFGDLLLLFFWSHRQLFLESFYLPFLVRSFSLFLFSVLFFLVTLPLQQVIFLLLKITSQLFLHSLFILLSVLFSRMLFLLLLSHLLHCTFFHLCLVCKISFTFISRSLSYILCLYFASSR